MASLGEGGRKLLHTLHRLRVLKEGKPRIRKELEALEKNVIKELLRLGWTMEQDEVADCANKEEEAIEDVADVTTMEGELKIDQVGPGSCSTELKELDEGVQHGDLDLQELFDERARLKKESARVEAEVKQVEEKIRKKLLSKKVVVIEQEELDYIDRLGTHYRNHPEDIRKLSSMNLVNGHLVGALKQNKVEGKLETSQARTGPSSLEEPNKEVKYLRRNVKREHEPIDTSEAEFLKKVVEVRHKTKPTKGGDSLKLSFVQVTVKGRKFAALVDTGATHSFLSRKAAKSFGKKTKMEKEWSAFKAVNSNNRVVDGVLKDTQIRVGSWFGKLDLRVVDMDDHSMVLGLDFLNLAQAMPMVDRDILLITAEGKTMMVLMNRRSCLGYRPRMNSMILYPKDPNVKHEDVEQRGLGSIVQTEEKKLVDFIAKAGKKNEGSEKKVSRTWRHLMGASSTNGLHNGVANEESPSATSKAVVDGDYEGRDPARIVDFCRYAMGIYDFQLTKDKLGKLGCTCEEIEAVHRYLRTQHQFDTWVDESQGGNFLALFSR